tara:strand:+ start:1190 stop:2467 length:1278 start_codon:yes stop_codon:yes gene_type:complete
MEINPRNLLLDSFNIAVNAAHPQHIIPQHLPEPPKGRTLVVGAGKAASAMAQAVENHWPHDAPLDGIVVTRYGHNLPTKRIETIEAGHPLPDKNGTQASQRILKAVGKLRPDDLLLCLFSGGGSSLLSLPVADIPTDDLKSITLQLLHCGATIQEINTVRKHLSAIQGGRLAAVCHAPTLALIISDVTGDDPTHIASGPCAPDPTFFSDALAILAHYRINTPTTIQKVLFAGNQNSLDETPKPGSPIFTHIENRIISNAHCSLAAAKSHFFNQDISTVILDDTVTGEASDVAKVYAALVKEIHNYPTMWRAPIALLSGGETTVTVKGRGRGGRNTEFLLSLTLKLDGMENVYALACDTDGLDGSEDNAGAMMTPNTLYRTKQLGINAAALLANNDAYTLFEQLGDLIITGPTYTNVNDYRVILIL